MSLSTQTQSSRHRTAITGYALVLHLVVAALDHIPQITAQVSYDTTHVILTIHLLPQITARNNVQMSLIRI